MLSALPRVYLHRFSRHRVGTSAGRPPYHGHRGVCAGCPTASFHDEYGHALCGVHLLRELTFLAQEQGCTWAKDWIALLMRMKHVADVARAQSLWMVPSTELVELLDAYDDLLNAADPLHPQSLSPAGKRGRRKHSPARNLLDRLRTRTS